MCCLDILSTRQRIFLFITCFKNNVVLWPKDTKCKTPFYSCKHLAVPPCRGKKPTVLGWNRSCNFKGSKIFFLFFLNIFIGLFHTVIYNIDNWVWTQTLAALCCIRNIGFLIWLSSADTL